MKKFPHQPLSIPLGYECPSVCYKELILIHKRLSVSRFYKNNKAKLININLATVIIVSAANINIIV